MTLPPSKNQQDQEAAHQAQDLALSPNWLETMRDEIEIALVQLTRDLGQELKESFSALCNRRQGSGNALSNFTRIAQPVAQLHYWTTQDVEETGATLAPAQRQLATQAAISGYLGLQAADDPSLSASDRQLLFAASLHSHQRALRQLVPCDHAFWTRYDELWTDCFCALSLRRRLDKNNTEYTEALWQATLRRASPLALPSLALLGSISPGSGEKLEQAVSHSVRAAQLLDDLLDIDEDIKRGRRTWLVAQFSLAEERSPFVWLIRSGGWQQVLKRASDALESASTLAASAKLVHVAKGFLAERQRLQAMDQRLLRHLSDRFGTQDARDRTERKPGERD